MTIESRSPGNAFGKWIPSASLILRLESPLLVGSTSVFFEIRPLAEVVGFKVLGVVRVLLAVDRGSHNELL